MKLVLASNTVKKYYYFIFKQGGNFEKFNDFLNRFYDFCHAFNRLRW